VNEKCFGAYYCNLLFPAALQIEHSTCTAHNGLVIGAQ